MKTILFWVCLDINQKIQSAASTYYRILWSLSHYRPYNIKSPEMSVYLPQQTLKLHVFLYIPYPQKIRTILKLVCPLPEVSLSILYFRPQTHILQTILVYLHYPYLALMISDLILRVCLEMSLRDIAGEDCWVLDSGWFLVGVAWEVDCFDFLLSVGLVDFWTIYAGATVIHNLYY